MKMSFFIFSSNPTTCTLWCWYLLRSIYTLDRVVDQALGLVTGESFVLHFHFCTPIWRTSWSTYHAFPNGTDYLLTKETRFF